MRRIGPGAAWAIEPVRLVHGEQTVRLFDDGLLTAHSVCHSLQGTPPCGSSLVFADACEIVFAHCALHGSGNISPRDAYRLSGCFSVTDGGYTSVAITA